MRLFDPYLYEKVHLLIVLAFTLYFAYKIQNQGAAKLIHRNRTSYLVYFYVLLFILVVGFRPVSGAFGDTVNYAGGYEDFTKMVEVPVFGHDSLFYSFMWLCSQFMSVNWFFFIVEILYVIPIAYACYRLLKKNSDIGVLFCLAAFSFFTYGTNGLRNGVACSLVFLAITFIEGKVWNKVICALLSILAIGFHASTLLPVACMVVAYFIKNRRIMFAFWILSIAVSLIVGNAVANLFAGLGFDDRIDQYIHPEIEEDLYTVRAFRWDFILYSFMPILLGYYLVIKKRIYNSTYLLLLGTYIFANAFWIMVIRAEFSNRFAYLSWFLYPIVLAYPLLRLRIWPKTQGRKTAIIMLAHIAFTLLMVLIA